MLTRDKQRPSIRLLLAHGCRRRAVTGRLVACALFLMVATSCNRMITARGAQLVKDADARAAEGDFVQAVKLYESGLDGSAASADLHYRLALLYDDKMNEPLHALHHFKRYLSLAPTGPHANDAKNFMKRDELALATSMGGDAIVTRAEAARLKNENLSLRKDIEERAAQARVATASEKTPAKGAHADKTGAAAKARSSPRSHVVESGDTLYSLSREYYGSSERWKDIRRANQKKLDSSGKLKPGQTLTIP